jgi:cytoskeletal protein CcmA (bactofilin family)
MASIIRIKRSGNTGSPSALAQGELAYSFLAGDLTNGGDRFYLGTGTETNGEAANVEVIGGKYFTSKLDHTPGTLTANSAIIVDDNKSIDELFFGNNLNIDSNSISTANGDITIDPAGDLIINGEVIINNGISVTNVTITGNTDIATLSIGDLTEGRVIFVGANSKISDSENFTFVDSSILTLSGQFNIDNLRLDGNTISSTDSNGDIIISPNGTGKIDVSSSIITGLLDPVSNSDAVNLQFLNAASFTTAADGGSPLGVLITTGTFTVSGGTGLTSAISGTSGSPTITLNLDNTAVTSGSYGSQTKIPTFTVDAQGRLTAASEVDVATTFNFEGDTGTGSIDLLTDSIEFVGGTGVDTVASGNTVTFSIGQDVYTTSDVTFKDGSFTGDVVISGDLTVNGNTTVVATQSLEVEDPLIKLARGNVTDTISIGFYGQYGTSSLKSGLFRSHEDGGFYLFKDFSGDITTSNVIDLNGLQLADANFADINLANLSASANVDVVGTVSAELFVGEIDGGTY